MFRSLRNCRWLFASVCAVALSCTGCGWSWQTFHDQIMGPGFDDEFAKQNGNSRPDTSSGNFDGMSTKSQQVEHDLGVR